MKPLEPGQRVRKSLQNVDGYILARNDYRSVRGGNIEAYDVRWHWTEYRPSHVERVVWRGDLVPEWRPWFILMRCLGKRKVWGESPYAQPDNRQPSTDN